uniref:Uncharacterized protein n=1 Tax=Strongyloides stercoralis TaxID=6248 RepID=A0AAF5DTF7_STRER
MILVVLTLLHKKLFSYIYDVCSIIVTTLKQEFLTKNENISNDRVQKIWIYNILKFCTKTVLSIVVKEGKKFIDFISLKRSTFVTYINDNKVFDEHKERFK